MTTMLVMRERPKTRMPAWRAATTSGTVLIPTASPPTMCSMRDSAPVSYDGPDTPA